jgi:hypothetical protein
MYCPNNNFRCRDQGYCNCHDDRTVEAAGGCGGILFLAAIGIFAAFLYPSIRIFRSNMESDANDTPKFAGAVWLFTSPVFGFLATMLYQLVFAIGACTAGKLESKVTTSVYAGGLFLIYALAIGLAVTAFIVKNGTTIKLFFTEPETRSVGKTAVLTGSLLMILLTVCAIVGVTFNAIYAYHLFGSNIENAGKKDEQLIAAEKNKFASYVGTYKFTTRNEPELFVVSKTDDGKNLSLSINGGKLNKANAEGCLLTPNVEVNQIVYSVSNCVVNGKQSLLGQVYFEVKDDKTKMNFIYNVHASGDTLVKIK